MLGCKGEKGQMTGALHRNCQATLVLGTGTGLAPGSDLAPIGKVPAQHADVFVVNRPRLFQAEGTNLAPPASAPAAPVASSPASLLSATVTHSYQVLLYDISL
jgi:hypothetical protein